MESKSLTTPYDESEIGHVSERASAHVSMADMMLAAINQGIPPEGIKTLSEVYERLEAARAEQAYNDALADFQGQCPIILKNKEITFPTRSGGTFTSRYAEMDTIIEDTRELRAVCGFSYSFEREVTEKAITVWCVVRHRGGHKTRTSFSIPLSREVKLSEAHAVAGAVTFCERYAFRGAFGITTGMPDNDGKAFTGGLCSEEQRKTLQALIDQVKPDMQRLWKYCGVETLDQLPMADFARVQAALLDAKKGDRK